VGVLLSWICKIPMTFAKSLGCEESIMVGFVGQWSELLDTSINPLTAVTSLGVKLFHVLNTTINIKDIF
jgi:hypothetical protein